MSHSPQSDYERFRVLLFRNKTADLLLETTAEGLCLPALTVPKHSRIAQEITAAIKDQWSVTAYCLFSLPSDLDSPVLDCYQIAEVCQSYAALPAGMKWFAAATLTSTEFAERADFEAIQASVTTLDLYRRSELQGCFGKPGWLQVVMEWVEVQAAGVGLRLTGKFRQLNACPTFSLLRFETDGPALWFKAVGEPNLQEYGITLGLAQLSPAYLPRVIASNRDWNAWLSVEAEGRHLTEKSPIDSWQNVAAALANLQIASFGNCLHLIELGCKDVRASSLLERVDPFFDYMTELMKAQTKQTPAPLTPSEITALAGEIRKGLEELSESKVPNVLGHRDCNPENILVSRERCVFLDWAEGCVGHPFFTLQYLLEHWRKFNGGDHSGEEAILSAYTAPWKSFFPLRHMTADLSPIPLAAAFACAASGSALSATVVRPEAAGFLRSITRRMKREADAWRQGRLACAR
jgi:phosphotransferase family enzyme